jgi:uncharacterized membrane protein YphA (DoxX/SURF4 family)
MSAVALVASIVVGLAFVLAGASKLAAGDGWAAQAEGLGAPLVTVRIVPWFELALGAALIAQLVEPFPAIVAIALLLVFTALIVRRLLEGRRPPCACFGAWSEKPIGAGHLARNSLLLLLAVLALFG